MSISPADALRQLTEGNERFAEDRPLHRFGAAERARCADNQTPWAVIVGCSDARVPIESVFDVGVGELFVIRTAGHVLAEASIASVRFAAEKLDCHLIVVVGHENCGAVQAAMAGDSPEWLSPILDHIDVEHVDIALAPEGSDDPALSAAVNSHVLETVVELRQIAEQFDMEEPVIVAGASYQLSSGEVRWLDTGGI